MIKIRVLNKTWSIIVRNDKAHDKRFEKCHAVAILQDRKIHIRKSSLNIETIIHELCHAYQHELSFYELQLDEDQIEEWFCELWAKYGEIIIRDSKNIIGG
jgi:hypothetical protein